VWCGWTKWSERVARARGFNEEKGKVNGKGKKEKHTHNPKTSLPRVHCRKLHNLHFDGSHSPQLDASPFLRGRLNFRPFLFFFVTTPR
jgi:hypothetical protein